jgi:hypothetical protein
MNNWYFPPQYPADDYINDLRVHAEYDWSTQFIDVRFIHYGGLGGRAISVGAPLEMRPYDAQVERERGGPTLQLRTNTAQSLMDAALAMRAAGRPKAPAVPAPWPPRNATLEDMRALVFQHVDVTKLPKAVK